MIHLTEETLNEYLDHTLIPSARADVDAHLAVCAECMAALETLGSLFAAIEALPDLALERDLTAAVVSRLGVRASVPRPVRLALFVQALAAIAIFAALLPLLDLSALQTPVVSLAGSVLPQFVDGWSAWLRVFTLPDWSNTFSLQLDPPILLLTLTLVSACLLWLVGNGLLLVLPRAASLKRRHS